MNSERLDRDPVPAGEDHRIWEERPAAGWEEFIEGRDRYLAVLAAQSAAWRASRRLPGMSGRRYDSAPVVQGGGARSR